MHAFLKIKFKFFLAFLKDRNCKLNAENKVEKFRLSALWNLAFNMNAKSTFLISQSYDSMQQACLEAWPITKAHFNICLISRFHSSSLFHYSHLNFNIIHLKLINRQFKNYWYISLEVKQQANKSNAHNQQNLHLQSVHSPLQTDPRLFEGSRDLF